MAAFYFLDDFHFSEQHRSQIWRHFLKKINAPFSVFESHTRFVWHLSNKIDVTYRNYHFGIFLFEKVSTCAKKATSSLQKNSKQTTKFVAKLIKISSTMPPYSIEIASCEDSKPKQWTFENVTDFSMEGQKSAVSTSQKDASLKVIKMGNSFKSEWKLSKLSKCQSQGLPTSKNQITQPQTLDASPTLRKCSSEYGQLSGISKPYKMRSNTSSPTNSTSPICMSPRTPPQQPVATQIIPPPFIMQQHFPSNVQQPQSHPVRRVVSFTFPIQNSTNYMTQQCIPNASLQQGQTSIPPQTLLPSFKNFVYGLNLQQQ